MLFKMILFHYPIDGTKFALAWLIAPCVGIKVRLPPREKYFEYLYNMNTEEGVIIWMFGFDGCGRRGDYMKESQHVE